MGAIRDQAIIVYADGPSGSPTEPNKAEIRELFRLVDEGVAAASVVEFIDGGWQTATAYERNNALSHNGVSYRSTADHTSGSATEPGVGADWEDVWDVLLGAIVLENGSVANAKLESMAQGTVKMRRAGAGAGAPTDVTLEDLKGDLFPDFGSDVAGSISGATEKTLPADSDTVGIADSADSGALKKLTFTNLASGIATRLGALINGTTGKTTPVDTDSFVIADSAASNASKKLTFANLRGGVFSAFGNSLAGAFSKATPVDDDIFFLGDSAASNTSRKITWGNITSRIWSQFGGLIGGGQQRVGLIDDDKFAVSVSSPANATRYSTFDNIRTSLDFTDQVDALTIADDLIYIGTDFDVDKVDPAGGIIQGTDKSTGLPLVGGGGGGGGSEPDLSLITLHRQTDALRIHIPQVGGSYVRWNFDHITNVGQRSDVWQVRGIVEATLVGDVSTQVQRICDTGQVEFAASLSGAPSSFVIGGNAHGRDEMLEDPTLLIDGVEVPINGDITTFTGRRIEIYQASQLLDPGDLSDLAKRYTRWVWEDGWFYLRNHLVFEKELEFGTLYMAMLPMLQLDDPVVITHSGMRSPRYYPVEDYTASSSTETDASHIKLWGDRYSGEIDALEGWEDADRESWVAYIGPSTNRNKIYFAPLGVANPRTPAIGSVLTMESRMRVAVNQSNS